MVCDSIDLQSNRIHCLFSATTIFRKKAMLFKYLLSLNRHIIGPWALGENNPLKLANKSMCYIHYINNLYNIVISQET